MTPDDTLARPPEPPPSELRPADRLVFQAAAVGMAALLLLMTFGSLSGGLAAAWAIPVVVLVGLAVAFARPSPPTQLGIVLAAQVLQLGGEEGLGAGELLAFVLMVGYLAKWYASAWLGRRPVVLSSFDAVALGWGTVGMLVAAGLGLLYGPDAYDYRADIIATVPFAFYLPLKDTCTRYRNGAAVVAGALVWFGLYATISNGLLLRSVISGATQVWEIADARFGVGETSIASGIFLCFGGLAVSARRGEKVVLLVITGALLGGLILTKSRGFWVSCIVGLVVLVGVVRAGDRRRLLLAAVLGVAVLVSVSLVFFGEQVALLAAGTLSRFATLSSAATKDISLINRFVESGAVWYDIQRNPIMGYGWGVQVTRFDIINKTTLSWGFIHNGYLALWHKMGLWGLGMMMWVWVGAMVRAALAGRNPRLPARERAIALGVGGVMVAFTIVASTSNPWSIPDQMLVITMVLAVAHGVQDRARLDPHPTDPA